MLKTVLIDYNPVAQVISKVVSKVTILANMADYLRPLLFNKDDAILEKILFLVGVTALTLKTTCFLNKTIRNWGWIFQHFINNRNLSAIKMKQTYGDCFVLITGFTQGLGRGYAEIFAEHGFNLLLVSRNSQKVEQKVSQLKSIYKNIRIEHFVCDFADSNQISKLDDHFQARKDLDIGIIINNAGSVATGVYDTIQPQHLVDDINADLKAIFTINRIMIPRLRARHRRSAIINLSSSTGFYLTGRVGVYSSAKLIIDVYSRITDLENRDKIDTISLRPFGVCTKMMKMKKGPFMVDPRKYARSSLAELLGGSSVSFGHHVHKFMNSLVFTGHTEKQTFKLFDKLWDQANLKKK